MFVCVHVVCVFLLECVQSTLLQLMSVALPIAFGDLNVLVVYHDFQNSGRGKLRHSLCSVICEAIKVRFKLTEDQLQKEINNFTGVDISKAIWACEALGKKELPPRTVTVVLIADELQHLFDNDKPSQSLLSEIRILVCAPGVASFFSGSAYHLVDGLQDAGMKMLEKQPIVRLLPITTRAELAVTQLYWHPSWNDVSEFPLVDVYSQAYIDSLLETRLFLETGGVLRLMIDFDRHEQPVIPEPSGSALAVMAFIYAVNRTRIEDKSVAALAPGASALAVTAARHAALQFDPFDQAAVPVPDLCTACDEDNPLSVSTIHELADAGWLLLYMQGGTECASFLRPKHFALMETMQQGLSLLERAAIRFPEGRTLGEQWESFYAEYLNATQGLIWNPMAAPDYGTFHHQVAHSEAFFVNNVKPAAAQ